MLILGSTPTPGPVIRTYVVAPRSTDWLFVILKTFLLSPGVAGPTIRSALSSTQRPYPATSPLLHRWASLPSLFPSSSL